MNSSNVPYGDKSPLKIDDIRMTVPYGGSGSFLRNEHEDEHSQVVVQNAPMTYIQTRTKSSIPLSSYPPLLSRVAQIPSKGSAENNNPRNGQTLTEFRLRNANKCEIASKDEH